jgi:hypothetical protein
MFSIIGCKGYGTTDEGRTLAQVWMRQNAPGIGVGDKFSENGQGMV